MTRGVKIRIVVFIVLSAIGITYIAANYLGLVDRALGRGITVHATLPTSGGLFEGSEVTYRGVKIGKVERMSTTRDGVELDLALKDGTELPLDSPMFVHNLTAIGEQYLDFEPPDDEGPYAEHGDTLKGSMESLPVDEADLLIDLDAFVGSVDKRSLQVLIAELGLMFEDTGRPLQKLIDSGGRFIEEANDHTAETIQLLETGLTVLRTQQDQGENIRSFARDLRLLTDAVRSSDGDLRGVLDGTPGTARQVDGLLQDLEPTLPVLFSDLIGINQTVLTHIAGMEQLLVTFPRVIAGGFTGSPPDGYGHVNLQYDDSPPCTRGYKPKSQWRQGNDLTDAPIYPARCLSGPPYNMRGNNYVPGTPANPSSPPRNYSSEVDPTTGLLTGMVDARGKPVRMGQAGDLSLFGEESWKWLLVGPTAS